jgi:Kef-type K+ transport system membrane component KefB
VVLQSLGTLEGVLLVLFIVALAVVTKFAGAGAAARLAGTGRMDSLIIGAGMVPRGEVGIIVATIALSSGGFSEKLFGVVVAVSVITTLIAPPVLSALIRRADRPPAVTPPQTGGA